MINKNIIFESIYLESKKARVNETLSSEEKMYLWHNGIRKFNLEAASTAKLRKNFKICKLKGYKSEAKKIRDEIKKRGLKIKN